MADARQDSRKKNYVATLPMTSPSHTTFKSLLQGRGHVSLTILPQKSSRRRQVNPLLSSCFRVVVVLLPSIPDMKPSLQAKPHSGVSRHRVPAHVFVLLFSRSTRKGLIGSTMRLLSSHVFHQRDSPLLQSTLVFLSSPCPSSNDNGCTTTCSSTPQSLLSTGLPLR